MDKVDIAITRLKEAAQMSQQIYGKPLIVTDSGGKDSSVCVSLAEKAGIPFEVLHNHTTADAPETVYFIRDEFKQLERKGIKCIIEYPMYQGQPLSMWSLISRWGPPNRWNRFCCSRLKENGGKGRFIVTGIRWDESKKRENRGMYETCPSNAKKKIILNNDNDENRSLFETCQLKSKRVCNPIIDWTDRDVWDYIATEHVNVNSLYAEGWSRVGCIGCPLASTRSRYAQFARWPKYRNLYFLAIKMHIKKLESEGKKPVRDTAEDVFHWWMEDGVLPGQINLFEEEED